MTYLYRPFVYVTDDIIFTITVHCTMGLGTSALQGYLNKTIGWAYDEIIKLFQRQGSFGGVTPPPNFRWAGLKWQSPLFLKLYLNTILRRYHTMYFTRLLKLPPTSPPGIKMSAKIRKPWHSPKKLVERVISRQFCSAFNKMNESVQKKLVTLFQIAIFGTHVLYLPKIWPLKSTGPHKSQWFL